MQSYSKDTFASKDKKQIMAHKVIEEVVKELSMVPERALEMKNLQELIEDSELVQPSDIKRSFEYNLSDKTAKSKILKGAKREPFEIVSNDSSSNLDFSIGAWNQVVQPAVKYWNSIKGDKTCNAGNISVRVASVTAGEDASKNHIDTIVVFYANREKVVCHLYNTTQRILVNGRGYEKLINHFLKPFFEGKIALVKDNIAVFNSMVMKTLGPKRVKRSTVKYKGGSTFSCNGCNFTANTLTTLKKHKNAEHELSFNSSSLPLQPPLKQSTRNNSISEVLLQEDMTISNLSNQTPELTLEQPVFKFTCLECKFFTTEKVTMDDHVKSLHGKSNFICRICEHEFLEEEDYNIHLKTHDIPKESPMILQASVITILDNEVDDLTPMEFKADVFTCDQCAFSFPNIVDLSSHLEVKHPKHLDTTLKK